MSKNQNLIDLNTIALREGLTLLTLLDKEQYGLGFKPAFQSNIGTHIRHVLEHYRCFFSQIECQMFRYDQRPRDQRLEVDLEYARVCITDLINCFSEIDHDLFASSYSVAEQLEEKQISEMDLVVSGTTLARELMFLQSHTVHHYAMIAAMCRGLGIYLDIGFGVAIPTRNYTQSLDEKSSEKKSQERLCAQ